ncbi:hypothetical protein F4778DRAFT_788828 [Xylariomycetidae sp. FL2044]|nr:hypothetical protein F4778DRAFT_788828 [Xylariomycetidae sp. FL2044]
MSKTGPKKAIVVGAGAGGIATAARLAKAGFSVTVLEKNSFTGGRCSLIHHEGYRFDQGPSLLLLPKLFQETFHDLDTSLEAEGVELLRCPTNYNVWFADGENFELSTDLARMKAQIERWEGKDGFHRYLAWLREAHQHYELSVRDVLHRNFTSFWDLMAPHFVWTGLQIHPLHSIWNRASKYFRTERLRRVFTFATMYMGMSPFDAPATYSLLQYTELAEGIWYPRGGFHAVLAALQRVSVRLGVEYWLDTPVKAGHHAPGRADGAGRAASVGRGARGRRGRRQRDLVYAYSNLFPHTPATEKLGRSLRQKASSCSSISFYWSLDRTVPELQTHNIFLADHYRESFDSIFDRQTLPEEPSFYINVPSRIDPSAAPAGRDARHRPRAHGPPCSSPRTSRRRPGRTAACRATKDWPALVARARESVLSTISARTGCAALAPHITHEIVNDPAAFFNVLSFRPGTRARGFRAAYFVGASTHPGTGVPIVLAGAKVTAEQILADLKIAAPWAGVPSRIRDQGVPQTRDVNKLDMIERSGGAVWFAVIGSLMAVFWAGVALGFWRPLFWR